MKPKYYAVRRGRRPGIYTTWSEASAHVAGFAGAEFRGFATRAEAEDYMAGKQPAPKNEQLGLFAPPLPSAHGGESAAWPQVNAYTDGSSIGNPGPGGWGAVLVASGGRKELSGGFRRTTNNRMELMACIAALEALDEPRRVTLVSDSRYLLNGLGSGAARRWQQHGWVNRGQPVPNADLWGRLLAAAARHEVRYEWVRGHTGHPENERCDQLATQAAQQPNLPPDEGYESAAG